MVGQKALARYAAVLEKTITRKLMGRDIKYKVYVEGDHVVVHFSYKSVHEQIIVRNYGDMVRANRKLVRYLLSSM